MKYVIFDIDGTLTDTAQVDEECFNEAFHLAFGVDITSYQWDSITHVTDWGITDEVFSLEFGRLPDNKEIKSLKTQFLDLLADAKKRDASRFREVKGARSFVSLLMNSKDFKVGIATGGWEESARFKLDAIGLSIDGIPFSNSNHFKSRESITNHVIDQIDIQHSNRGDNVVYFGDGLWDYKTCKSMGIKFIGIDSKNDGKLSSLGVKDVFGDFIEMDPIMRAFY